MKIVRFTDGNKVRYGILQNETIVSLPGTPYRSLKTGDHHYHIDTVRLLAPCLPSKIVALGLNYRSHAVEIADKIKQSITTEPLIFLKPSTSVIGPEDQIIYPESSHQVDYEGELGVIIKNRIHGISRQEARQHVLGYTCVNDVTARDLQIKDKQWTRAKGFDTFAAIGPCIETELDPADVPVETYLNGVLRQQGTTSDLIFSVAEMVSFISQVMTLLPGDIIATGTPAGVGPMRRGDTVEVRIPPVGVLRNYVA